MTKKRCECCGKEDFDFKFCAVWHDRVQFLVCKPGKRLNGPCWKELRKVLNNRLKYHHSFDWVEKRHKKNWGQDLIFL